MSESRTSQALNESYVMSRRDILRAAVWGGAAITIGGVFHNKSQAFAEEVSSAESQESFVPLRRIGGADRFETARLIADANFADHSVEKDIIIVTGGNFPDAMTAAPHNTLIIPVDGRAPDSPNQWTRNADLTALETALRKAKPREETGKKPTIHIFGGTSVVDGQYEKFFEDEGFYVKRTGLSTRVFTAEASANQISNKNRVIVDRKSVV